MEIAVLSSSNVYHVRTVYACYRMFELKASIPLSKDLRVRVKDYDLLSSNDIIGQTTIDLENRYLSQFGGLVGLPLTYCTSGACQWRDSRRPTQLLEEFCRKHLGTAPVYPTNTTLNIGQRVYKLADFGQYKLRACMNYSAAVLIGCVTDFVRLAVCPYVCLCVLHGLIIQRPRGAEKKNEIGINVLQ